MMLVDQSRSLSDELDRLTEKPPAKKRSNPERLLQVQVVAYLRRALPDGNVVFSIENERQASVGSGKFQQARFQAARRASGVLSGVPDICAITPGYPTVWIEMKAPKGRMSDAQLAMHQRLRAAGQFVGIARSIEDAVALMDEAGVRLTYRPATRT